MREHAWVVDDVVRRMRASRRLPANVLREDLIAAGRFGLVECLQRHRGAWDERFERYARMRIRGAVFDELRAQDWLPRRQREAHDRHRATQDAAAAQGGSGWFGTAQPARRPTVELVDAIPTHGVDASLGRTEADHDPTDVVETRSELRALAKALVHLPERERRAVSMHYFEGARLKEVGAALGVGEPRVSQLLARALGRLRDMLVRAA